MTRIQASALSAQNIGSVITFTKGDSTYCTTIEGIESPNEGLVWVFTPLQDNPIGLNPDELIEISLQHGALYTRQMRQDMERMFHWIQELADEVFPHEEVAA